ncbi:MAG: Neelaredoxin, partial [Candidatus Omnitrophica bacterium]|nr:Neelaredoxin [Candidatus Omnitrophota bacterium]
LQSADWKTEKHVPAIEAPAEVGKGQVVQVSVSVGREIAHPNTTEHHIRSLDVSFLPEGEKFPYCLAKFDFTAHGESAQGPNTSTVYTAPSVVCSFKTDKPGTLFAVSYCNIHGFWQSAVDIKTT